VHHAHRFQWHLGVAERVRSGVVHAEGLQAEVLFSVGENARECRRCGLSTDLLLREHDIGANRGVPFQRALWTERMKAYASYAVAVTEIRRGAAGLVQPPLGEPKSAATPEAPGSHTGSGAALGSSHRCSLMRAIQPCYCGERGLELTRPVHSCAGRASARARDAASAMKHADEFCLPVTLSDNAHTPSAAN
jgi:hypothetical protein